MLELGEPRRAIDSSTSIVPRSGAGRAARSIVASSSSAARCTSSRGRVLPRSGRRAGRRSARRRPRCRAAVRSRSARASTGPPCRARGAWSCGPGSVSGSMARMVRGPACRGVRVRFLDAPPALLRAIVGAVAVVIGSSARSRSSPVATSVPRLRNRSSARTRPPVRSRVSGPGSTSTTTVLWTDPAAALDTMVSSGARTLFLQTSNGDRSAPFVYRDQTAAFVEAAHDRDVEVVARYLPHLTDLAVDRARTRAAIAFTTPRGDVSTGSRSTSSPPPCGIRADAAGA